MKKIIAILIAGILLFSAGCGMRTTSDASSDSSTASVRDNGTASEDSSAASAAPLTQLPIGDDDLNSAWDEANATKIALGDTISVNGSGAEVKDHVVTITSAGTYVLNGTLADGQIVVAATKEDLVRLVLNGVQITNKSGAAIYASQCDKLIVTLASETQNSVTDGGDAFVYTDTAEEEPNAALFSKDDLTVNGTGALIVNAGFNNGIGTKDNLIIVSGDLTVNAANHGIRGNDSVAILDGNFSITAGNDGIQTSNAEESGMVDIRNGAFTIVSAHDGIQSENGLLITGGDFDITAGGANASKGGVSESELATTADGATVTASDSDSYKGIKAAGNMEISAGTFTVDSADDSVHGNSNITVSGGDFTLASGDDGIHADSTLAISGGEVNVTKSFEGLEGSDINISGGTITAHASDDGINAAGGTDANVGGGNFGNDRFNAGGAHALVVSGGNVTVFSGSDGIDSNGTLDVSDGTVAIFVNAPRDGDATDTDGGGTIIPALYGNTAVKSGTEISVGDWNIVTEADATAFCLILPGIVNGQSYQITANGSTLASVTATTSVQGMMMGGQGGRPGTAGGKPGQGEYPGGQPGQGDRRQQINK